MVTVGPLRFERRTLSLKVRCSNQLSYEPLRSAPAGHKTAAAPGYPVIVSSLPGPGFLA